MKKLLYILSITMLLFSSCSSDDIITASGEPTINSKQKVSLNISASSSTQIRSTDSTELNIQKIIYAAYKIDVNKEDEGYSTFVFSDSLLVNNEADLPNINFELEEGKYVVVVFASQRTNVKMYSESTLLGQSWFVVDDTSSPNEYLGRTNIEVANQPINETIQLDRAVGKVEIVITDLNKLPDWVQSISTRIETFTSIYQTWTTSAPYLIGFTKERYARYSRFDIKVPLLTREQFSNHNEKNPILFYSLETGNSGTAGVPNITSGGDLYLYLNDATGEPSYIDSPSYPHKVLVSKSVKIYPNKISRFVGRVTGDEYGFSISVQQDWDNDPEIIELEKHNL